MSDYTLLILAGVVAVCFAVIVIARRLERKFVPAKHQEPDMFVIGRIYQMEDGTMAKYLGNGKFIRVKEDKK